MATKPVLSPNYTFSFFGKDQNKTDNIISTLDDVIHDLVRTDYSDPEGEMKRLDTLLRRVSQLGSNKTVLHKCDNLRINKELLTCLERAAQSKRRILEEYKSLVKAKERMKEKFREKEEELRLSHEARMRVMKEDLDQLRQELRLERKALEKERKEFEESRLAESEQRSQELQRKVHSMNSLHVNLQWSDVLTWITQQMDVIRYVTRRIPFLPSRL